MHVPLSIRRKVNDFKGQKPAGGTLSQDILSIKGPPSPPKKTTRHTYECSCVIVMNTR